MIAGGLPQRYVKPEDEAAGSGRLGRDAEAAGLSIGSFHVRSPLRSLRSC